MAVRKRKHYLQAPKFRAATERKASRTAQATQKASTLHMPSLQKLEQLFDLLHREIQRMPALAIMLSNLLDCATNSSIALVTLSPDVKSTWM